MCENDGIFHEITDITRKGDQVGRKKRKTAATGKAFSPGAILPFKYLIIMFLSVLLAAGSAYGLRYFFMNSPFFSVTEIIINNDRGFSLEEEDAKLRKLYLGRNIFKVDLKGMRAIITKDMPQLKKVETRRELPDTIAIDIFSRVPVAVVESSGGIVVDKDGVVLTIGEGDEDLVNIRGLSYFLKVPARGERIKNAALQKALVLIMGISSKMSMLQDKIEYVDISDKNNIVLGVQGVPVKMGEEAFLSKLTTLKKMINDPNLKFGEIKYIDLRFDDPVISPK